MIERSAATKQDRVPGILDLLSDGMSLLLIAPWLIALPLLVDFYLMAGPGLASGSLTAGLGGWVHGLNGQNAEDLSRWLSERGSWDITRLLAFLLPSVVDGLPQSAQYQPVDRPIADASSWTVAFAGAGLLLLGSLLYVGYLTWLASTGELLRSRPDSYVRFILTRWSRLLSFAAVIGAGLTLVTAALVLPGIVLSADGMSSDSILGVISLCGLAALVITMFVPEAIMIDGAGPFKAIHSSATVVFRSFWQSVAFFIVSFMISPGLLSVWKKIADQPVGLGIAIVLNAALVTSLSLASLSFYKSRIDRARPSTHSV